MLEALIQDFRQPFDRKGKRFFNPHIEDDKRTLKDALLWKTGYFDEKDSLPPIPKEFSFPLPKPLVDSPECKAVWINHSTFLLDIAGIKILTDPIWSQRCSPFRSIGPVRKHPALPSLEELGAIDHVLISHNHYDHLDKPTIRKLKELYPNLTWWVPLGVKEWFSRLGIDSVYELGWWQRLSVPTLRGILRFAAVPAQHFSGRTLRDKGKTLWAGWVVELVEENRKKRLYFAGDTGYNEIDFKEIGKMWPGMDLSLLPIGSYVPRKFMSPVHIDPWQAVQIHKDVSSKQSLAMHWNTFRLSDEERDRPPYDLYLALQEANIDPSCFLAVPPGYATTW